MDETIGVKGGRNDRRRVLKNKKDKELKNLEKEVKKQQKYTLIKTIPIVIVGSVFKELTNKKKTTKNKKVQEENIVFENNKIKDNEKTKPIIIVLKDGTKQVIQVPIKNYKQGEYTESYIKEEKSEKQKKNSSGIPISINKEDKTTRNDRKVNNSNIVLEELNEKQRNKLQKLQARKIIDIYENELKNIRYELRNLIIDYNTLVDIEQKNSKAKEEENILNKLNEIIRKIEELKDKIKIEDLDKYDDNYIYTLIEGYLYEFKDKRIIKEIKDSELYILISEKLDEFDKKKDTFRTEVEDKKNKLELKEERFEEIKAKSIKLDKINQDISEFYKEQEQILKEMQDKIDKSLTVTEKVKVQVETMNMQTRLLLARLSLLMLIPGRKGAKALIAMADIYKNMSKIALQPKTIKNKYKEITVYDYSDDIKRSIKEVEKATNDLSKTREDIDKYIKEIKEEFSDYIGIIPECSELLHNLEKVKDNIKEKEYELEKIKGKQEKELERNNSKVLKKGVYYM